MVEGVKQANIIPYYMKWQETCASGPIWKASNVTNYPYKPNHISRTDDVVVTRAAVSGHFEEKRQTNGSQLTCRNDALHIWNKMPSFLKESNSLYMAKNAIKTFVKKIPL